MIIHHAIIVTSWNRDILHKAHSAALQIFGGTMVTEILESPVNGYLSFFIGPDGSKEGWEESNSGNEKRGVFIQWMNKQEYEDGSNCLQYVEVTYNNENSDAEILCFK